MKIEGNLIINNALDAEKYAGVTSIGGDCYVRADFQPAALTSIGGNCYVNADFQAAALTSIGGYCYVNADFQAAALTSIGGYCYVYADFQAAALTSIGGLPLPAKEIAEANLRTIAPLALAEGALEMRDVHVCETTHCMAGWACHALPEGPALEAKHGWSTAGTHLLGFDAMKLFQSDNDTARKFLEQYA